MAVRIEPAIEIWGPHATKPWRPAAKLITNIGGLQYIKLEGRCKALGRFLGIPLPLGRSIGLASLQKTRNEAIKAKELAIALAEAPAAGLFGNARPTAKRKRGEDASTIDVER